MTRSAHSQLASLGLTLIVLLVAPALQPAASAQEGALVQEVISPLPLRQNQPSLDRFSPRFIIPSRLTAPVRIEFQGSFFDSAKRGLDAELTVNGHVYKVVENTNKSLVFLVSPGDLIPEQPRFPIHGYTFSTAILNIHWRVYWFVFRKTYQVFYKVTFGWLPPSPGTVTVSHMVTRQVPKVQRFTTRRYEQTSDRADDIDRAYSVSPDTGWEIVRNTTELKPAELNEGEWHWSFDGDDGNKIRWRVTTVHHALRGSGKIGWVISFMETRTETETETVTETVDLHWGDSRAFPYPSGTWKVSLDAFDGSHHEYSAANSTDPFVKIQDQAKSLVIAAADPATLDWPKGSTFVQAQTVTPEAPR
jgi:hypothetical protein